MVYKCVHCKWTIPDGDRSWERSGYDWMCGWCVAQRAIIVDESLVWGKRVEAAWKYAQVKVATDKQSPKRSEPFNVDRHYHKGENQLKNFQRTGVDLASDGAATSGEEGPTASRPSPPWRSKDRAVEPAMKEVISLDKQIKSVEGNLAALNRKQEYSQQDMRTKCFLDDSLKLLQDQLAETRNSNQKLAIIEKDITDLTGKLERARESEEEAKDAHSQAVLQVTEVAAHLEEKLSAKMDMEEIIFNEQSAQIPQRTETDRVAMSPATAVRGTSHWTEQDTVKYAALHQGGIMHVQYRRIEKRLADQEGQHAKQLEAANGRIQYLMKMVNNACGSDKREVFSIDSPPLHRIRKSPPSPSMTDDGKDDTFEPSLSIDPRDLHHGCSDAEMEERARRSVDERDEVLPTPFVVPTDLDPEDAKTKAELTSVLGPRVPYLLEPQAAANISLFSGLQLVKFTAEVETFFAREERYVDEATSAYLTFMVNAALSQVDNGVATPLGALPLDDQTAPTQRPDADRPPQEDELEAPKHELKEEEELESLLMAYAAKLCHIGCYDISMLRIIKRFSDEQLVALNARVYSSVPDDASDDQASVRDAVCIAIETEHSLIVAAQDKAHPPAGQAKPGSKEFRDLVHCRNDAERDSQGRRKTIAKSHGLSKAAGLTKAARASAHNQIYADAVGELSEHAAGMTVDPLTGRDLTRVRTVQEKVVKIEEKIDETTVCEDQALFVVGFQALPATQAVQALDISPTLPMLTPMQG